MEKIGELMWNDAFWWVKEKNNIERGGESGQNNLIKLNNYIVIWLYQVKLFIKYNKLIKDR